MLQQDSFWRERVSGFRELSEEKIRKRMECLELRLEGPEFCVILFAPYLMEKEASQMDPLLLKLRNTVRDSYEKAGMACYTITDTYCNVVCVLSVSSGQEYRRLIKLTQRITNDLIKSCAVNMYVGIGQCVNRLSHLNRSRNTAAEALSLKFNFSEGNVIAAKDVMRYYSHNELEYGIYYDRILGCFYDGNPELLENRLTTLLALIRDNSDDPLNTTRNVCIELTAALLRVVREMGVSVSPGEGAVYTSIAQMGSVARIGEWFLNYCAVLMQKVSEARNHKTAQIIQQAERFIEENIRRSDVTLQAVSDYVGLSAPYFSSIFYQEKGIHISEYTNRVRVRQAQKELLETREKVNTIAKNLGFSSPSYFNNVFKRYTGTTPNRFREGK